MHDHAGDARPADMMGRYKEAHRSSHAIDGLRASAHRANFWLEFSARQIFALP